MNHATTSTRKICRDQFGTKFDPKYGYVTAEASTPDKELAFWHWRRLHGYTLQYIDGCFYPWLVKTN